MFRIMYVDIRKDVLGIPGGCQKLFIVNKK